MQLTNPKPRRIPIPAIAAIVLAGAMLALATTGTRTTHAEGIHAHSHPSHALTSQELAFHDSMRKLWEDHVTWTRLAIISFAGDMPDLSATEARLLANQVDIGNAIKPFYGERAGDRLTRVLRAHIVGAVELMQAAKSRDKAAIAKASSAWYANGDQVADFLSSANPYNWPRAEMRAMMKTHLDQTLSEATNRLTGRYSADVRDYDAIHRHILEMADVLSDGIVKQFPHRFR
jgi:hypothetical protein